MKEKIEFKNLTLNATKLKFQRHLVQIAPVRNWKEGGGGNTGILQISEKF